MHDDLVFLVDVDNTLLHNDTVMDDFRRLLLDAFGLERERRYWDIFEQLSAEVGYADYLGALQRFRVEWPGDLGIVRASMFLLYYPFNDRLYPGALDVIEELQQRARVVIFTDGDIVYQPNKVERSGLWQAVHGDVLICVHKEEMLDEVERRYPARRYVMVDDKIRILAAMKAVWGARLTTVLVKQGRFAHDQSTLHAYPPADRSIDRIEELTSLGREM